MEAGGLDVLEFLPGDLFLLPVLLLDPVDIRHKGKEDIRGEGIRFPEAGNPVVQHADDSLALCLHKQDIPLVDSQLRNHFRSPVLMESVAEEGEEEVGSHFLRDLFRKVRFHQERFLRRRPVTML